MAGHSKFKNIMHRKGAQDKKKSKLFSRIAREITVAARSGTDISMNPALRTAIANGKSTNMPKDRIERAIDQGSGNKNDDLEEIRYEGYGPCGVAIIVEALTNNRNRTAASIRSIFNKHGGNLGETGSATFSFNKVGAIYYDSENFDFDKALELAVENGAKNIEKNREEYEISCEMGDLYNLRELLIPELGDPLRAEITWIANNTINIEDENKIASMCKILDSFDNDDDILAVFHNSNISND